ncbi:hypothetical protein ECE50_008590 [Chitinophaga sp. Mgbs1]|uniref:Uncharacterized protein n=1 Tax=Chitinophaga solisilvae TaxID=1233460 RepID=A0A3S1CVZ4_9BACT|nr:hypothetical protein [Chitinophaga solisilvae]
MNTYTRLLLTAALSATLFSCSKEMSVEPYRDNTGTTPAPGGNNDHKIYGVYDFVAMSAATKSTSSYRESGDLYTNITTSKYTSFNNTGLLTIVPGKCTLSDLSYAIDTKVENYSYINGVADGDMLEMPWQFNMPKMKSESPFRLVGTDSIYFEKGLLTPADNNTTGSVASEPSGTRYSFSGDTLVMKGQGTKITTNNMQGMTVTMKSEVTFIVKYRRKK